MDTTYLPSAILQIAAIGVAGIIAQWMAWRLRIPAIALLLAGGFLLGPVLGWLDPKALFGELYKPIIGLAVAIVLFEGGLTLNFKEIRHAATGVKRMIFVAGPLVWVFSSLAAHYGAGLSWPSAIVLGAILVITGPTVIMPLLRSAQLRSRPAALLRWEAILNDAIGALFAVIAFEVYLASRGTLTWGELAVDILAAAAFALAGGFAVGYAIAQAFGRGLVPEYLKVPIVLVTVLALFSISDALLKESGLLTVTVMGVTLANSRIASLTEMRRFKETVTVLLVSGLFIMLVASLKWETLASLGWPALVFVVLILFVARPAAVFLATIGSGLTIKERTLVAWIAPRGVVAVAVSGLFGASLAEAGVADGERLTALAFAVVATTIIAHGFSLGPLARLLDLKSADRPGVLVVGGSGWANKLAEKLQELELPTIVVDNNWNHIRAARLADVPVHFGEILSEAAHHDLELNRYSHLIAATDNDAYNSLVCTEFGPELGRDNVFQIGQFRDERERNALTFTLGGRPLFDPPQTFSELRQRIWEGWAFQATPLTDEFGWSEYLASRREGTLIVLWIEDGGNIVFGQNRAERTPEAGDRVLAFGPPPEKQKSLTEVREVAQRQREAEAEAEAGDQPA